MCPAWGMLRLGRGEEATGPRGGPGPGPRHHTLPGSQLPASRRPSRPRDSHSLLLQTRATEAATPSPALWSPVGIAPTSWWPPCQASPGSLSPSQEHPKSIPPSGDRTGSPPPPQAASLGIHAAPHWAPGQRRARAAPSPRAGTDAAFRLSNRQHGPAIPWLVSMGGLLLFG